MKLILAGWPRREIFLAMSNVFLFRPQWAAAANDGR
jgi:hypothetical protein